MTKQIVVGNFISPHFIDQFLRPTLKNCLPFFPFSMQFSYTFSLDGVFSFSLPLNHLQCPCITNALAAQFENGRLRLWHCREQRRKILNVKRKPSLRVEQGNETLNSIACACAIMKKAVIFISHSRFLLRPFRLKWWPQKKAHWTLRNLEREKISRIFAISC